MSPEKVPQSWKSETKDEEEPAEHKVYDPKDLIRSRKEDQKVSSPWDEESKGF